MKGTTSLTIDWDGAELEIRGRIHAAEPDVGIMGLYMDDTSFFRDGIEVHFTPDEEERIFESSAFGDALTSLESGEDDYYYPEER